jgi:tetratricopeptide (TPR) repeat protein
MSQTSSLFLAAVLVLTFAAPARAAEDAREVEGRALFARGEYDGALQIFSKLFAERADPVYLRNIGRSYQMLKKPERAIGAFREYLRRSASIAAEERAEVEGFIKEMETLAAQQSQEAQRTRENPPGPPPSLPRNPPTQPPAAAAATQPAGVVFTAPTSEASAAEEKPLTRRWWFWTAIGAVLVTGTVTAIALSSGGSPSLPPCPMGAVCPR